MTVQQGRAEADGAQNPPADKSPPCPVNCDGHEFREAIESGTRWLEAHIDFVNSLNVYPVPDGDTGTNMYLTMRAALREISTVVENSISGITRALAHGALMGARGNSGVILSQVWRGVAKHLDGKLALSASDWALALREGAVTAYKGVMRPVEGTILTVVREAAEAGVAASGLRDDLLFVLERVVQGAGSSLQRTPELLPVLKEAGVVDAGGQGLVFILEGFLRYLRGEPVTVAPGAEEAVGVERESIAEGEYGYDIQFLLGGHDLPIDAIREQITAMGDSVLVVGDADTIKVHVHSDDPGRILSYATTQGLVRDIVVENMQQQYREFLAKQQPKPEIAAQPPGDISTVVVVQGEGLRSVFESLGAGATLAGGQTMNPSTEELLEAISSLPNDKVIVLPNNPNVIMTAQQARRLSPKDVIVVPTTTIPQGIGALLAFNYQSDLKTNADLMERAAAQVQTIEITSAVRSVQINGLTVQEGQFIGLLNGELVGASDDLQLVTQAVLQRLDVSCHEVITVYWGDSVTGQQAQDLVSWLGKRYPGQEIELIEGKQPHYQYIISVE